MCADFRKASGSDLVVGLTVLPDEPVESGRSPSSMPPTAGAHAPIGAPALGRPTGFPVRRPDIDAGLDLLRIDNVPGVAANPGRAAGVPFSGRLQPGGSVPTQRAAGPA